MSKTNRGAVLLVLVAVLIAMGGISLLKGGFFIGKHEGDTIHLVDIVMRMSMGQKPHSDFMTPIGFLAFAPMSMFVAWGSGIGHAIIQSQIFVAIALLPAIWWVSVSRLPKRLAMGFGVVVLVMILALVHGEANSAVSISMHYNRWAWALAYLAIMGSILPPIYGQSRIADGAIIGGAMAALVLIKVTYFVAFALPVVLALIVTRQIMTFVYAVIAGLFVAGAVTAFYGVDFWFAYLADLQAVASSETRAAPGLPLDQILIAPAYMGITAMGVAGVILLRQAGAKAGGLCTEALVMFDRSLARRIDNRLKQSGQQASKARYLAAPLLGMLESGEWESGAANANLMARRLAEGIASRSPFALAHPVEANAVFVRMSAKAHQALNAAGWACYRFDDGSVRFVCSWATTESAVDELLAAIIALN